MDEPNVLKLEHRHRALTEINADLAETVTEWEDARGRLKTVAAAMKEEIDAAKESMKQYSEERRKAVVALEVMKASAGEKL